MRAVVQRVKRAKVEVDSEITGEIDSGLLVFLGIGKEDGRQDADYLLEKIINLRIFEDEEEKLNLSAADLNKDIMLVSQFTLFGDCRQGRRPSFFEAAPPAEAEKLYNYFVKEAEKSSLKIETGEFQAMMDVSLINDGPVTILVDSKKKF
ncbi:D-aminoacyl-tRNA deacylase [Halanaerobium saccharolyticum]|jgi:D-tyrosyl-tRNA(Tyr) deacylase|uniref:D-aminoacyl-tRNA deacylase n=1 Tax=Halanaerobium saccharolyticum TaxID=43595 RepID=A0A2T5RNJ7_9FIRM|nr:MULTISPECIES: D-aminoacyl-tRNA deacylase [Halanaerobium]PTW01236.1 D-tyrosyl-tRNA(Tyr) deacylase [Halanaerobium saccharolyticum]PUU91838.1 MAG: D-tyrosyl-tRNA(Tyr) deacylase [Halanaerobium sp.]TDP94758.1 D-tyrosyl-tRNA(Tyr) deacylase [Halanaerobium saccharolyticum]